MFALSLTKILKLAAAGSLVVLGAFGVPAHADELPQSLGPVGPHEPILTTVGSKRVIAFYVPGGGRCAVHMVIGDVRDPEAALASRIRVELKPGQMVHLDSVDQKSLNLECGDNAERLAIVKNDELVAFGEQQGGQSIKASTSGF
jgi:hypothetical protein